MSQTVTEDKVKLIKVFMDTFRWEQDYYHRNKFDVVGTPVGEKKYNRFENGKKVFYTTAQFKQKVKQYAESLGVQL